jgi:hypothetical protein
MSNDHWAIGTPIPQLQALCLGACKTPVLGTLSAGSEHLIGGLNYVAFSFSGASVARDKRGLVVQSLAFLAFLLYAVAHAH